MDKLFNKEQFVLSNRKLSWKKSIILGSQPLVNLGKISSKYTDLMIDNVIKYGPYIVVSPNLALAHARPEGNVKENAVSVLINKKGIIFGSTNDPVKILFIIAAKTNNDHIEIFKNLAKILGNRTIIDLLIECENYDDFYKIIEGEIKNGIK